MNINTIQSTFVYAVTALKRRFTRETACSPIVLPRAIINQAGVGFYVGLDSNAKMSLKGRYERGVNMAYEGAVSSHTDPYQPDRKRMFKVRSSKGYSSYLVDLDAEYCECPDHAKGFFCKHLIAASIVETGLQIAQPDDIPDGDYPGEFVPDPPEYVVWGVIRVNGDLLGVEILNYDGEQATVRALPKIIEGKKLQPQFPFEGRRNLTTLPKKELFHVRLFRSV